MKNLFLLLTVLFFVINTEAQTSTSLSILDTRNINDLPNFSSYSIRADFKTRSVIGVPGDGYYSANLTFSPWETGGNSGGKNHQLNFNDGGVFYRTAFPTDNQWGTWRQILMTNENGNVGIGTISPSNKLHIIGDALKLAINENANNAGYYALLQAFHAPDTGLLSFVGAGGGGKVIGGANYGTDTSIYSNTTEKIRILNNGNVGIGTISPDSKLTVNGNIHAKEVKIDLSIPVPDYVFANAYKLKSLEEVEAYIKQNNHLPEIPSAQEIEKNGLMLAEMNMSLLKKVEELTLYMIALKKENEQIKKDVSLLQIKK